MVSDLKGKKCIIECLMIYEFGFYLAQFHKIKAIKYMFIIVDG